MKCVYGSRKSDGLGGHGAEVVVLNCDHYGNLCVDDRLHPTGANQWDEVSDEWTADLTDDY